MRKGSRVILVVLTLLASFAYQRTLAHGEVPPPRHHLESLPFFVGPWSGTPEALPADILAVLGLDDYLLRRFSAANGAALTLYVAYYGHQNLNGRIHSPSACLPGGGWLPVDVGYQEIAIPGDSSARISANRFLIEKGADRQVVLYWFQGRGRVVANDIQATLFLAYDTLRGRGSDETLVRVSAPVGRSPHDILADEVRFVQHFYPQLQAFFVGS